MLLRSYEPGDAPSVLALNQTNLDAVGPLDPDRQAWLISLAEQALVADEAGVIAGFVLTLAPGTAYDSPNYRWFEANQPTGFCYLDRVIVHPEFRRRGIATALYDAAEAHAVSFGAMTLEVYAEPPNHGSLSFHRARGYTEVGRLAQANGKVAAMFTKRLTTSDD